MKNYILIALVALGVSSTGGPLSAITITNPLTLQTQFVAGIHNGQQGNSNVATETVIAQNILNLGLGQTVGFDQSNTVFNYGGTITGNGGQLNSTSIPAGWDAGLAKYDGPNGGYVLFLFGDQASTIPQFPWNFWTTNHEQYALSHVTLFSGNNFTPTPTSVPEGGVGVAFLGLALAGLGVARRVLTRQVA